MRTYTDEQFEVFRLCIKLKAEGCKTSTDAEKIIYKSFWKLSRSDVHSLVNHWFHNRDKIEFLLDERAARTKNESISELSEIIS